MSKKVFILASLGIVTLGVVVSVLVIGLILRPRDGILVVESQPSVGVFVDGAGVGRAPVKLKLPAGEVLVGLVPDEGSPLLSYTTQIEVVPGVETIVRRKLGETREGSSGVIVSFEDVGVDGASVSVISIPDGARVSLGVLRGTTPVKFSGLEARDHQIKVEAAGYVASAIDVQAENGFNLTVVVNLEKQTGEESPPTLPGIIEILQVPTDFLTARISPGITSEAVGKVSPGDTYEVTEVDSETGWYKIELEGGAEGWIASVYTREKPL